MKTHKWWPLLALRLNRQLGHNLESVMVQSMAVYNALMRDGRKRRGETMELTMSMFATQADYWKARAEMAEATVGEVAAELGCGPDNEELLRAANGQRAALAGMVTLLETLRTDGESRYCYVEARAGQMVNVADAIDSANALLGPNIELTGAPR